MGSSIVKDEQRKDSGYSALLLIARLFDIDRFQEEVLNVFICISSNYHNKLL